MTSAMTESAEVSSATMAAPAHVALSYQAEVDGLRAVAVVPVVLFHAGFVGFSAGYLGVDVFFAISGYLITGILLREHDGAGGERDGDANLREPLPEESAPTQQEKQSDAADDGRQHQRDGDRRTQEAPRQHPPANGTARLPCAVRARCP